MNRQWLLANRHSLVRDLVRDYCRVQAALASQQERFATDRTVSWAQLHCLLGESTRKGVFWQLKDTAHLLFGSRLAEDPGGKPEKCGEPEKAAHATATIKAGEQGLGALLDWCIGYAFHECLKLREDAYQGRQYANRLHELEKLPGIDPALLPSLKILTGQTEESSARELSRILRVLDHGLDLLLAYLPGERANACLARWLATETGLAAGVFAQRWQPLLATVYGDPPQALYRLAAEDYARAGRLEAAQAMRSRAEEQK